jgi:hypothetical protein
MNPTRLHVLYKVGFAENLDILLHIKIVSASSGLSKPSFLSEGTPRQIALEMVQD